MRKGIRRSFALWMCMFVCEAAGSDVVLGEQSAGVWQFSSRFQCFYVGFQRMHV